MLVLPQTPDAALSIRAKALVFEDPASSHLLERVDCVARSDATVLLIGETGTGKELIARRIHTRSGRTGPFVAVNCGAFSESLIDAELFGHESGAFTGAGQARQGWFEAAQRGTLFLDEIGDLTLALQVKLLRVLQERQVVRLGSRKPIALDVRLVAATNIDLAEAVQAQHFRADLYYRLSVATLHIPPLRERPGDVMPLARHFMAQYASRLGQAPATLSPDAQDALLRYAWPGNIRELENVVHFALIVAREGVIRTHDLKLVTALSPPGARSGAPSTPDTTASKTPADPAEQGALDAVIRSLISRQQPRLLQTVEACLVQHALQQAAGNQVQAARLLGITRNTLRTLVRRHMSPPALRCAAQTTPEPHSLQLQ